MGELKRLPAAEQAELQRCEGVIYKGWMAFVEVGLALAQIRDKRLYRAEYVSFEHYCHERWGFQHAKAYYQIAAAQLYYTIAELKNTLPPTRESQLRPLMGLELEAAKVAWQTAASLTSNGQVTARLVKSVVQQLGLVSKPQEKEQPAPQKVNRAAQRQLVRDAMGELLRLIVQKGPHDVLLAKFEALSQLLQPFLA